MYSSLPTFQTWYSESYGICSVLCGSWNTQLLRKMMIIDTLTILTTITITITINISHPYHHLDHCHQGHRNRTQLN